MMSLTNMFKDKTKLLYVGLTLIVIIIAGYYLKKYIEGTMMKRTKYEENVDDIPDNNSNYKTATVYFFFTTWCPYSLSAIPEWEKIVAKFSENSVNGYNVKFVDLDCTEDSVETEDYMNKFNITGYPTIKMVKDDQIIEFDAKTNEANIEKFLYSVL